MSEPEGLSGEEALRLVTFREIEQLLEQGFRGQILLHCPGDGTIREYELRELRAPGKGPVVRSHRRNVDSP